MKKKILNINKRVKRTKDEQRGKSIPKKEQKGNGKWKRGRRKPMSVVISVTKCVSVSISMSIAVSISVIVRVAVSETTNETASAALSVVLDVNMRLNVSINVSVNVSVTVSVVLSIAVNPHPRWKLSGPDPFNLKLCGAAISWMMRDCGSFIIIVRSSTCVAIYL